MEEAETLSASDILQEAKAEDAYDLKQEHDAMMLETPETALMEIDADALLESDAKNAPNAEAETESLAQERVPADRTEEYKTGIKTLMEDGWTREELTAFSTDDIVRQDLTQGKNLRQAARAYLLRTAQQNAKPTAKRGVPTSRTSAAGDTPAQNPFDHMTDAEFDRLAQRAHDAAMSGQRVKF